MMTIQRVLPCLGVLVAAWVLGAGALPAAAQTVPTAVPTAVQAFTYYCQAEDFTGVAPAPAAGQWGRVSGTYFGGTAIQDGTTNASQAVSYTLTIPADGTYYIWIAHLTATNAVRAFDLAITQNGASVTNVSYATALASPAQNDANYIYRPGSWEAWSMRAMKLPKGTLLLKLAHNAAASQPAMVDALQIVGASSFTPDWNDTITKPFSYWMESEAFDGGTNTPIVNGAYQWVSDYWNIYAGYAASGGLEVLAWGVSGHPLTHTFTVPKAGTYYLWMAHNVNPSYHIPETLVVQQNGVTVTSVVYGAVYPAADQSGPPEYHFQVGTWRVWSVHPATLQAGPVTLKVYYNDPSIQSYAMWDMMQIVDNPTFTPQFGSRYGDVPDFQFRVRLDAIQSTTLPAPTGWQLISYYDPVSVPLTQGVWSAWVSVSGSMKSNFYNMYYNLYSGHRWPFVSPFVIYPYSVSNMTMSVEWQCGPVSNAYSATYDGGGFGVLLWRDSQAPLPHQVGPSWLFNRRYVNTINSLNLTTNNLPRQFVFVDRYIGVDYDRTACEEGLGMLRNVGMTVIDASGNPRGKQVLTALGIGKTAGAVYIPPTIFDTDLSQTTDAAMDTWARSQAAAFTNQGWSVQDVAWYGISDEPGWYYPSMFTAGPSLPGVFRTYLQNKGFVPADFGKASWTDVNFVGRSGAVSLPSKRLFYWSMRFFPDNSADVFARWVRALERAFYPGIILPVNWNNFEGRYYTWGGIANNPTPNDPDAAMGSHDWINFGRRRGTTTLWTEDWFGDSYAPVWSAYVSKLRSGTYRYNDARTNGAPPAINFGGYVIGATAGGLPGGTLQKVLSILGNGGKSIYFYIFGPEYSFPGNCYSENFVFYPELADALRVAGQAEDLMYAGQPVRTAVAILQPQSSECWDTSSSGADYMGETFNLYKALQDSHIPADWVDEQDIEQGNLGAYKVIYVTGPNLSAEAVTALQAWIQAGGVAVFTAGAAQYDRYDEPSTAINATLGIGAAPQTRLYWPAYTNMLGAISTAGPALGGFQASGIAQALTTTTASVQARFSASSQPAITMNVVGSGRAIVWGAFVGTAYARNGQAAARDWVAWPVHLAGVTLPVDFNAPQVEAATLQATNGLAVTLLNWSGATVSNLAVTVRSAATVTRVDSVRLGASLPFTQGGGVVSFSVPTLGAAEVLKLYATATPPPPPAPTGLTAVPSNAVVSLSWNAVAGAATYRVKRSTVSGGPYTNIVSDLTSTVYTNTGLSNGTTYYYVVLAVNDGGKGPISAEASATPVAPPAAPTGLTATPGNGQVVLAWTAAARAASYTVKRATVSGGPYTTVATGIAGTTFTNTGLANGTTYYYVVVAANAGGVSGASSQVSATPSAALPSPWQTRDIGAVAAAGAASYSNGTFTVAGSGADIGGVADEFRFVYQLASGNCDIIARVASVQNVNASAKAGVMIRETLTDNARHALVVVTPGSGAVFQRRTSTGGTTTTSTTAGLGAPYWVRITRSSNTVRAYVSADGVKWASLGSINLKMSTSVYIGLAVTSHSDGVLDTATFTGVAATP